MPCPGKVLIVDDDAEILASLAELLAGTCGAASVVVAHDGAEALALLRGGLRPCRVLTDLQMAGMSGDDLIEALAAEGLADIPVISMTGALRPRPARAAVHLAKPFTVEALGRAFAATANGPCQYRRPA